MLHTVFDLLEGILGFGQVSKQVFGFAAGDELDFVVKGFFLVFDRADYSFGTLVLREGSDFEVVVRGHQLQDAFFAVEVS